jgi:hypothetical protein
LRSEQPIDLVPAVGDLRGHCVAEHVGNGAEQMVPDDGVLLGSDSQ